MSAEFWTAAATLVLVPLLAFFMRRALGNIDKTLAGLSSKLDALAKADALHDIALTELRVRMSQVDKDISKLQLWQHDISNFFSSLGFKKRGAPDE